MNRVIKILILSDIYLFSGWGLMAPIFAVFVTEQIRGGNLKVAGYASAVYWIVKSIATIPFGKYLDKNHGEKDDLWFLIIGNLLGAFAIFGFIFSTLPWHIYLLEAIYALGMSMNIPAYTAIFTRHIDKDKVAFEWGTRSALLSLGTGIAGAVGGITASYFGFKILFLGVAFFFLVSGLLPLLISKEITSKEKKPELLVAKGPQPPHPKE